MTKGNQKLLCEENLRHAEYYSMLSVFDDLHEKSKSGVVFEDLMPLILKRENILLAYRNIKTNTGSKTAGTDQLTIGDIGKLSPDEVVNNVRYYIQGTVHGYRPKPVRRKDIPKPYDPMKTRPLGIPCIWDRLIQQCIKQIMEPICEAKFSINSYGFRPNCSAEHAIAAVEKLMQQIKLHYVIEFDIKGFFDNVNHSKLIRQIWSLGIHDKHLIFVLKRILSAPIRLENGTMITPKKGTPQGGIISPLLANIVLNELDHWIEDQWTNHPTVLSYKVRTTRCGTPNHSYGFKRARETTRLKEMYIVRYADDFRIFCRKKTDAEKAKIAVTQWLHDRLKLEISEEKTKVVNVSRHYTDFLGFKIKVMPKKGKQVIKSHVADKNLAHKCTQLIEQAKRIASPREKYGEFREVQLYNSMVTGMHNYYQLATLVAADFRKVNRAVMTVLTNRLRGQKESRLAKHGRELTKYEKERYGESGCLRFDRNTNEPIYPAGYVRHKIPLCKKRSICCYTAEGRKLIHDNLRVNMYLLLSLMTQPLQGRSVEYFDNRISHFSAQWGKCAVTGREFMSTAEIHCHHIIPKRNGGTDKYDNLILITPDVHILLHAKTHETIEKYKAMLRLNSKQLSALNSLRQKAGLATI